MNCQCDRHSCQNAATIVVMDYEGDIDDEDRYISGNPEPHLCVSCCDELGVGKAERDPIEVAEGE